MGDNKGDTTKKQQSQQPPQQLQQQQQQPQQQQLSSSPKNPLEESTEKGQHHHQQPPAVVVTGAPYISAPLYVPIGATSSSPFEQQFEPVNPKRQRYNSSQWKLLPSPSQQQQQKQQAQMAILTTESSPSPTTLPITNPQSQAHTTTASSSDTASSPPHSPIPSLSAASGQETSRPELLGEQFHPQFRKGKYVSPVWKPNEMLWLARAWRIQYQGGGGSNGSGSSSRVDHHQPESTGQGEVAAAAQSTRAKTRADKDREVAEFLQRHGVNRDAKTSGTKWDNMLGEFRKVYEWERGGEREQVGKSYFRLSPYERKLHRLPASFDEEVFEELSQFMGSRMRSTSQSRAASSVFVSSDHDNRSTRALPPPPPFKEDDLSLSGTYILSKYIIKIKKKTIFFSFLPFPFSTYNNISLSRSCSEGKATGDDKWGGSFFPWWKRELVRVRVFTRCGFQGTQKNRQNKNDMGGVSELVGRRR